MTVEYRVRSRRTRWTRKFRTLAAAEHHARTDWGFKDDPTVYIQRIVVDTV
jgi:hypothetical protein